MTVQVEARDQHRRVDFDGVVTWTSRRRRPDSRIAGTLRVDLGSDPILATAAVVKSKVDNSADYISPGLVSKAREFVRDVPILGSIVDGVENAMGVAVVVSTGDQLRTLRGSLRFERRPHPVDEPVAVTLSVP
ncbi:MAG TPA: hypothetical protein VGE11_11710 [Pseudonocardia sp.]